MTDQIDPTDRSAPPPPTTGGAAASGPGGLGAPGIAGAIALVVIAVLAIVGLTGSRASSSTSPSGGAAASSAAGSAPGSVAVASPSGTPKPSPTATAKSTATAAPSASAGASASAKPTGTPKPSPTATPKPTAKPTAVPPSTASCANPATGVTVVYPATWYTVDEPPQFRCVPYSDAPFAIPSGASLPDAPVAVLADGFVPYDDALADLTDPAKWTTTSKATTTVSGLPAVKVEQRWIGDAPYPVGTLRHFYLVDRGADGSVLFETTGEAGGAYDTNRGVVDLMASKSRIVPPS